MVQNKHHLFFFFGFSPSRFYVDFYTQYLFDLCMYFYIKIINYTKTLVVNVLTYK